MNRQLLQLTIQVSEIQNVCLFAKPVRVILVIIGIVFPTTYSNQQLHMVGKM